MKRCETIARFTAAASVMSNNNNNNNPDERTNDRRRSVHDHHQEEEEDCSQENQQEEMTPFSTSTASATPANKKLLLLASSNRKGAIMTAIGGDTADGTSTSTSCTTTLKAKPVLGERNSNCNDTTMMTMAPASSCTTVSTAPTSSSNGNRCTGKSTTTASEVRQVVEQADEAEEVPSIAERLSVGEDDSSLDAVSVGLMASGLAWVRQKRNGRYGTVRSRNPLDRTLQEQRKRLQHKQKQQQQELRPMLLKKVSSNDSSPMVFKGTPPSSPPRFSKNSNEENDEDNDDKLQVQSCPTSPFFATSIVEENPITAQQHDATTTISKGADVALTTSSSVSLMNCTSEVSVVTVALSPWTDHNNAAAAVTVSSQSMNLIDHPKQQQEGADLAPRFNPVNNIYSLSNFIAAAGPSSCSSQTGDSHDYFDYYSTPPNSNNNNNENDDEDDRGYHGVILPLGYFCQQEGPSTTISTRDSTKSHMRSALDEVLLRMGSTIDLDDEEHDDEQCDSISDDDSDVLSISWIPRVRCVPEYSFGSVSCSSSSGSGSHLNPSSSMLLSNTNLHHHHNNYILSPKQMHKIARHVLPKGIAACQWKRLYSLARDGDSFDVCLHYVRHNTKTLLVVRTTRGAIFGGYAGEAWTKGGGGKGSEGRPQYYGNNETCLFTFEPATTKGDNNKDPNSEEPLARYHDHPQTAPSSWQDPSRSQNGSPTFEATTNTTTGIAPQSPPCLVHRVKKSLVDDDEDEDDYEASLPPIRVFKYKGVNRYIQYCDASRKMLAFGGGGEEGSFGLCLEQEFQVGSTGHCDTFDNEPLCAQENFNIVDVEIWGFLTGHF